MSTTTKRYRGALNMLPASVREAWAERHAILGGCKASMGGGKTCGRVACPYPSHWGGIFKGGRLYQAVADLCPEALNASDAKPEAKAKEAKPEPEAKAKAKPETAEPKATATDGVTVLAEALDRVIREGASAEAVGALDSRITALEDRAPEIHTIHVKVGTAAAVPIDGVVHGAMRRVLYRAAARVHCMLSGPTGSGKTHLARQVAEALSLPFYTNSLTAGTSEGVLVGRLLPMAQAPAESVCAYEALVAEFVMGGSSAETAQRAAAARLGSSHFAYVRSDFVRAYEEGGVYLADECDAADPNVLLILNQALANHHLPLPHRPSATTAVKHPDFVCLAAANTWGHGSDRQYVGRGALDEAFLDRFRMGQIPIDYDDGIETALVPTDVLSWGRRVRDTIRQRGMRRVLSTRNMLDAARLIAAGAPRDDWRGAYFSDWSPDDLQGLPKAVLP